MIRPNVRGSTGYGKTFLTLDNGRKREDSVKDIGALLDWIATAAATSTPTGCVVIGGSYGGYMSLAVATHLSRAHRRRDRRRRHLQLRDLPREHRELPARPAPRRVRRRARPGDARLPDQHLAAHPRRRRSPSRCSSCRAATTRACRGPRPSRSSREARASGATVWYLLAENEGHGFARKENADYLFYAMTMFMRETLLR